MAWLDGSFMFEREGWMGVVRRGESRGTMSEERGWAAEVECLRAWEDTAVGEMGGCVAVVGDNIWAIMEVGEVDQQVLCLSKESKGPNLGVSDY